MQLFRFVKRSDNLGQGVSSFALLKPQTNAPVDLTGAGRPVMRSLNPLEGPQLRASQVTTAVSLRGNGVYLSGTLVLNALMDFNKRNAGA